MRLPFVIACLLFSFAFSAGAQPPSEGKAAKKPVSSRKLGLSIRVAGDGWGGARREQIESVLYSVADALLTRLPDKLAAAVVVTHTDESPFALYERGPGGEYQVQLRARDERWHLYAYEFAHELCHIMANFEHNAAAGPYNQWFEETLCETASLFALERVAAAWEERPPYAEWSEQPARLRRFAQLLIAEGHRRLPQDMPPAAWLAQHEPKLRGDPYQREKNEVVANLLLPLFQGSPESWDALCYLNLDAASVRGDLRHYLGDWYAQAPAEHKSFIAAVRAVLGAEGPLTAVAAPALSQPALAAAGQAGTPQR